MVTTVGDKKWDVLVNKFEQLGGIAKNIIQKEGENGRGIFQINNNKVSEIFIPYHLMIDVNDLLLFDNKLRIKKNKNYNDEIKDFFNFYQDNFSWGKGGRLATESFELGLKEFQTDLKELFLIYIGIDLRERHQGEWKDVIMRQFLKARQFEFNGHKMICPILELLNHNVHAVEFQTTVNGIRLFKISKDELEFTYSYSYSSALKRAMDYGFFCQESMVFSLPFKFKLNNLGLEFICEGNIIKDDNMRNYSTNNKIIISGLPIASKNKPLLIYNYFNHLIDQLDIYDQKNNLLKRIIDINRYRRKKLIKMLDSNNNDTSLIIQKAINYELDLLSDT